ncbi:MAG: hypothetical protein E4H44_03335, partial [Candidatus Aminicenantes bacterium]
MKTRARDTGDDPLVPRVFFAGPVGESERAAPGRVRLFARRILAAVVVCTVGIAGSAAGADPVARVNGEALEGWELERELALLISAGSYHRQVSDERRAELRCQALRTIVLDELKRQWAGGNPVTIDAAAEEAAWREVRDRFSGDAQYRGALESKGISEDNFRRAFHRDAVAAAVDESLGSGVKSPSETQVEVFFILHGDDYMTPEARHVVHVLVYVPPSATREEWLEAEQRARDLVREATAGESSLLVAAKPVLDQLPPKFRDQVGDIGFVHRGSLQPAVDEAVFAVEPGSITEPVSTIYGYHVLQVISTRPPKPLELADVRSAV